MTVWRVEYEATFLETVIVEADTAIEAEEIADRTRSAVDTDGSLVARECVNICDAPAVTDAA